MSGGGRIWDTAAEREGEGRTWSSAHCLKASADCTVLAAFAALADSAKAAPAAACAACVVACAWAYLAAAAACAWWAA